MLLSIIAKKILFCLLLLWAGMLRAEVINHVWILFPGGTLESQCRALWTEYDQRHATKTVYVIKPGADGIVAAQDMLASKASRKFICGGATLVTTNAILYPESNYVDQLQTLIQTNGTSLIWYVPITNRAKNLTELVNHFRALGRPVNIGVYNATQRAISIYLSRKYDFAINLVPYKSGPQIYPDLAGADIDMAFDGGAGVVLAQTESRFRVAGYLAAQDAEGLRAYTNFGKNNQDLAPFMQWIGIMIPADTSMEYKKLVAQQLQSILALRSFHDIARQNFFTVTGITQPEITNLVTQQRKAFALYLR